MFKRIKSIALLTVFFSMFSWTSLAFALSISVSPKEQTDYVKNTFYWRITVSGQDDFTNRYGDGNLSMWLTSEDGTYWDNHKYSYIDTFNGYGTASSEPSGGPWLTIYDYWMATVI